ncbi:hypothetical protein EDB85DRAFT_2145593 [Lactarius pseudohatsudake]|nr:hypothetical protein EDB85DRAFT_2145593 [Lactarius pseudohatsudake]
MPSSDFTFFVMLIPGYWKHVAAKRPRNALLREKGILVHETWITPALLRSHLLEAGHKPQHVHAVLNPNDKQDVLLAYTLLRDIWSLPQLTSGAPGRIKARDSLRLLGSMCYHFLMPYICVDLSIGEQLEYLSYAAHLALVLYVHENARNDFIPTALYVDLIMMVKNVFFCVAKAKIDTPNDDFSIVLLGTDRLENLFGCLQTIIGNDANVDNYQLGSRLTGTMESANILAMHPEWDKAPRRLHLPCVSRGSSEIPASADHISPRSWRASQALSSLTPPTVWIRGRRKLEADHPFVCDVLCAVEAIPDATLLAPFGTLLVHASLSGDDFEDSSHDNGLHSLVQDAVLSDHPDVPLAGGGMCELEDAAASLDWAPDQHSFSNVVAVDENTGTLNKSRALSLLFKYSKSTSSTDRLRRVQQEARFVQSEPKTLVDDNSDELENILMVNNPIASLVSCEENIFLCIGEIIGIHLGSKAVDYLRLDVLLEDTVHITYQVYGLVCMSPDDDKHDDNEHKYEWKTQNLLPIKFKVLGNLIQPINPSLAMPPSHAPFYLFETPTLIAFTSSLRDRLTKPQLKFIPQIAQSDRFPYQERSGEACFVAEALYDVRESSVHECPACTPPVQLDTANGQRVLAHIASHILHDPSVDKSQEPCGLCLRPANMCTIYLTRRSGRGYQWMVKYRGIVPCPNAIKFSYSAAMVSSKSSPCSNVPLQCPYCPDGSPAVWRYNMQLHFRHRHQGVDTAKHEDLWKITSAEAKAMAGIWKTRHKQPKRRGKGKQKVPLKLSEAHSSRKLSSYMAREDEMVLDEDQDSDVIKEGLGGNEYGDEEDDGIGRVTEAEGWEPAGGEREDDAECIGESALSNEKDTQARSDCVESGDGARGLGVVDERGGTKMGDVSVDLVAESNERAPEPPAGVPVLPLADVAASLATGRRTGTEDDGSLLRGAQMSSFGRKRKLRNMQDISVCLCGNPAAPSAGRMDDSPDKVVCCRTAGCETKWYHLACVGLSSPPRSWICEVCLSDAEGEVVPLARVGPIDGATVTSTTEEGDSGSEQSDEESEEDHLSQVNAEEQEELTNLANQAAGITLNEVPQAEHIVVHPPDEMTTTQLEPTYALQTLPKEEGRLEEVQEEATHTEEEVEDTEVGERHPEEADSQEQPPSATSLDRQTGSKVTHPWLGHIMVQSPDGGTPNNSYRTCGKSDGEAAGTFNHSSNSERPDDDDIDNGDDGGSGGSDNNDGDGDDTTVNGDTTDNDGDTTGDDGDDTTDGRRW